jgi:hypothetical protein
VVRSVVFVALLGCYGPSPAAGAQCATGGVCPTPLVCLAHVCATVDEQRDALLAADAPTTDGLPVTADASPSGPILLLHMDDSPTDGALDSAGDHSATCTTCPMLITDGRIGGAYHFDGSDLLLVSPDADFTRTGPSTLAMWVRIGTAPATYEATIAKNLPPKDASYGMSIGSDLRTTYYTSGSKNVGSAVVSLGDWHQYTMTWDGSSTVAGYYDGVLDDQYTTTGFDVATTPLSIGAVNGSNNTSGDIDELAYYDRVLSQSEISALANP